MRPPLTRERLHRTSCSGTFGSAAPKKTLHASERDTPRVERLRASGRKTRRGLDPRRLIFVDESGVHLALTRLYARAPRGVRAVGAVPQNYGQSLTVLAALDWRGMRAALLVPGATDREVFLSFLEHVLGPPLRAGTTVVLDNLTAHKGAEVAEAIRKTGAQLSYLPPYSPDYNPIEPAWSKIKTFRRGVGARTRRKLSRSRKLALAQVTAQNAQAWFRRCGYPVHEPQICSNWANWLHSDDQVGSLLLRSVKEDQKLYGWACQQFDLLESKLSQTNSAHSHFWHFWKAFRISTL